MCARACGRLCNVCKCVGVNVYMGEWSGGGGIRQDLKQGLKI